MQKKLKMIVLVGEISILFFQHEYRQAIVLFKRNATRASNIQSLQIHKDRVQRVTPRRYQVHIQRAVQNETMRW